MPLLKKRNASIASFVSTENSLLARLSDETVLLPLIRELCPHDLAPMTSPSLQMILGDILIAAIMKIKSFSIEQYALNHPAGAIGQKITCTVRDFMITGENIPLCRSTDLLVDAVVELTNKKRGCLLVVDQDKQLLGIFTDGDLRRAIQKHSHHVFMMPMNNIMTSQPLVIHEDKLILDAMNMMQKDPHRKVMMLPVVESRIVKGLICLHDIAQIGFNFLMS